MKEHFKKLIEAFEIRNEWIVLLRKDWNKGVAVELGIEIEFIICYQKIEKYSINHSFRQSN